MTKEIYDRIHAQVNTVNGLINTLTALKEPLAEIDPVWLALDAANIHLRGARAAIRNAAEQAQKQLKA